MNGSRLLPAVVLTSLCTALPGSGQEPGSLSSAVGVVFSDSRERIPEGRVVADASKLGDRINSPLSVEGVEAGLGEDVRNCEQPFPTPCFLEEVAAVITVMWAGIRETGAYVTVMIEQKSEFERHPIDAVIVAYDLALEDGEWVIQDRRFVAKN